jgi:hypothetical protein
LSKNLIQTDGDAANKIVGTIVFVIALHKNDDQIQLNVCARVCKLGARLAHLNLKPVIALHNLECVIFVPSRSFTTLLMCLRAPFLLRAQSRLQNHDAIWIIFAKEIDCEWRELRRRV